MKESGSMGKVHVTAMVENVGDLLNARQGMIPEGEIRRIEVLDALVDTGATSLSMPGRMIRQLGLSPLRNRKARTSAGVVTVQVFGAARLTVQGRDCTIDLAEVPEDCPVLIGQVPLELLDFVVDPNAQRLIGNPEHGGEHMIEMY